MLITFALSVVALVSVVAYNATQTVKGPFESPENNKQCRDNGNWFGKPHYKGWWKKGFPMFTTMITVGSWKQKGGPTKKAGNSKLG